MKKIVSFIAILIALFSCSEDEFTIDQLNGSGIWIEKFPEKFEGIHDTLEFRQDQTIGIHRLYEGYSYKFEDDLLIISTTNDDNKIRFLLTINSHKEIELFGFPLRLSQDVRITTFTKPEEM